MHPLLPLGLADAVNQDDELALLAWADFLAESGDVIGEDALRWCIEAKREPSPIHSEWNDEIRSLFTWKRCVSSRWFKNHQLLLPAGLFGQMDDSTTPFGVSQNYRDYRSRFGAYAEIVAAWQRMSSLERRLIWEYYPS